MFACLLAMAKAKGKGPDEVACDLLTEALAANQANVWTFYESHLSAEADLIKGLSKQAEQPAAT